MENALDKVWINRNNPYRIWDFLLELKFFSLLKTFSIVHICYKKRLFNKKKQKTMDFGKVTDSYKLEKTDNSEKSARFFHSFPRVFPKAKMKHLHKLSSTDRVFPLFHNFHTPYCFFFFLFILYLIYLN